MLNVAMHTSDQSSIFSTGGKFCPDYGLFFGVTRSYSSRPFLCALDIYIDRNCGFSTILYFAPSHSLHIYIDRNLAFHLS